MPDGKTGKTWKVGCEKQTKTKVSCSNPNLSGLFLESFCGGG